tara:strand:+ start:820 stop:1518 length:699 start_codon:yes stop_codon:yes gene_type:complete
MNIIFITPFPETIISFMENSMIKKAQDKGLINYKILNLFDYADQPHQNIDDYPFGGGTGMVMKPEPIFRAFDDLKLNSKKGKMRVVYPSPDGKVFNQNEAKKLKENETLVFICGHYKGVDQRVRDNLVTDEYSIGDYVITGGELSSLVISDSVIRLIPGVLNNIESAETDSFESNLLDCEYYTRPEVYRDLKVPEILLSGHHQKIKDWKLKLKKEKTKNNRPDLWLKYNNEN